MLDSGARLKCYELKITDEAVLADEVSTGEARRGGTCKAGKVYGEGEG